MGFFRGIEPSDVDHPSSYPDVGVVFSVVDVHPLWKLARRSVLVSVSHIVQYILGVGTYAKIGQPVIGSVSVDVIHDHPLLDLNSRKSQCDSVGASVENSGKDCQPDVKLGNSFCGCLEVRTSRNSPSKTGIPHIRSRKTYEVTKWPVLPPQFSCFGIVVKTLAQRFNRWQYRSSIHSGIFSLDVRRNGRVSSLVTPFFLQQPNWNSSE